MGLWWGSPGKRTYLSKFCGLAGLRRVLLSPESQMVAGAGVAAGPAGLGVQDGAPPMTTARVCPASQAGPWAGAPARGVSAERGFLAAGQKTVFRSKEAGRKNFWAREALVRNWNGISAAVSC